MVTKNLLEKILRRLSMMLWDFLKGFVGRCEDSAVRRSTVQYVNDIIEFVNELGKLGCILATVDELINSLIGFVMVWVFPVWWMMWVVRMFALVIENVDFIVAINSGVQPALGIEGSHRLRTSEYLVTLLTSGFGGGQSIVKCVFGKCYGILEGISHMADNV